MMEVLQPTSILRSNAPSWDGLDDKSTSLRILQEHSGNRQIEYAPQDGYLKTDHTSHYGENHHHLRDHKLASHAANVYRHKVANAGYTPGRRAKRSAYDHDRQTKKLYQLFLSTEGYQKYRERQPRGKKATPDQKWPDDLEFAFFKALVTWPPMGRRKLTPPGKGKLMGRNELIADELLTLTGAVRTRKQVSSHIQVLKHFVEHDSKIMRYLSRKDAHNIQPHDYRSAMPRRDQSSYSIMAANVNSAPPDSIIPISFQMLVQHKTHEHAPENILHYYTSSPNQSWQRDQNFSDLDHFRTSYPLLAAVFSERPMDGKILAVESSLAVLPPSNLPKDCTLGIRFLFEGRNYESVMGLRCLTTIYENGVCTPEDISQPATTEVHVQESDDRRTAEYQVPFRSGYWAKLLHGLGGDLDKADQLERKPLAATDTQANRDSTVRCLRQGVENTVRNLTALQEIYIPDEFGMEGRCVMTIHWTFKPAPPGQDGETVWRNVSVATAATTTSPSASAASSSFPTGGLDAAKADPYHHQSFDFAAPVELPSQYNANIPSLRSPIHFPDLGGVVSSMPWSASLPLITSATDLPILHAHTQHPNADTSVSNADDFLGGQIAISYVAAAPGAVDMPDHYAPVDVDVDFDIPSLHVAPDYSHLDSTHHYHDWAEYDVSHSHSVGVFDPQLGEFPLPGPAAVAHGEEAAYAQPQGMAFEGYAGPEYSAQAYAGAVSDVKKVEEIHDGGGWYGDGEGGM